MMNGAQDESFAHGASYGDDFGVVFYGAAVKGIWDDRLGISDRFIEPIFCAIVDRCVEGGATLPRIVSEWNKVEGWCGTDQSGPQEISKLDATEFILELLATSESDLAPHVAGATTSECVRCCVKIATFLRAHIDRGQAVYIESD